MGEEALRQVREGVNELADAVGCTLGPKGRNMVLDRKFGSPIITKDGVTVAQEITFKNRFKNMGAAIIKQAAEKTGDAAGDATTTSVVLAQSMVNEGAKAIAFGASPLALKRGMDAASAQAIKYIKENVMVPMVDSDLEKIATISANDASLGKEIATTIKNLGKESVILVEDGHGFGIETEVVDGMKIAKGFISPYMVTDPERMTVEFQEPAILVTTEKIVSNSEIIPALEALMKSGKRELLIICEDMEGEAMATLLANKARGVFKGAAIKAPSFGDRKKDTMTDIAIMVGATLISKETGHGLDKVTGEDFGTAGKVVVSKEQTIVAKGVCSEEVRKQRIEGIKKAMETAASKFDKENLRERLANLAGGIGVIKVGAATEAEMKEKKHRVEDAVAACKAALESGIVIGGGLALAKAGNELGWGPHDVDEMKGMEVVKNALSAPFKKIVTNAGEDGPSALKYVFQKDLEPVVKNIGFNAKTSLYCDMIEEGIIDPAKAVISALTNATSAATMVLTAGGTVIDDEEDKPKILV